MTLNNSSMSGPRVVLIVPPDVRDSIFPWGATNVADYVAAKHPGIVPQIWDMSRHQGWKTLRSSWGKTVAPLKDTLRIHGYPFAATDAQVLMLAACLGGKFLSIVRRNGAVGSFGNKLGHKELDELHHSFVSYVESEVEKISEVDASRVLLGFSVYNNTLFSCLSISKIIKSRFPNISLIFGGGSFTFDAARQVVNNAPWIDGIVVGFGEKAMSDLVGAYADGGNLNEIRVRGFVNAAFTAADQVDIRLSNFPSKKEILKSYADQPDCLSLPSIPEEFLTRPAVPPRAPVRCDSHGKIRVLAQQGCSYGRCTFCTQLYKRIFIPFDEEGLIRGISAEIASKLSQDGVHATHPIEISLDADDHTDTFLEKLSDLLVSIDFKGRNVRLLFQYQVKRLNKRSLKALVRMNLHGIDSDRVHLNIESLNPATLKHMKKGHTPLKAIFALKACSDAGFFPYCNYMRLFPLQDDISVAREVYFLEHILHFFGMGRGYWQAAGAGYSANNLDEIYSRQEDFNIVVKRYPNDIWLREAFGFDMPFSHWAFDWEERKPWSNIGIKAFQRIFSSSRRPLLRKFSDVIFGLVAFVFGQRSFRKRLQLWLYLKLVQSPGGPDTQRRFPIRRQASWFYLRNEILYKAYNSPLRSESWQLRLTKDEIEVFRFLYAPHSRDEVYGRFRNTIDKETIDGIVNRHLALGAFIEDSGTLMSVVNDKASFNAWLA